MATKPEIERLAVVEEQQKEMKEAIKKLDAKMESVDGKLDDLASKFDNLTGGKQALMWIAGIFIAISGLVIAAIREFR